MTLVTVIPTSFTGPSLPDLGVQGFADEFGRPDAATLGSTEGFPARPWQVWAISAHTESITGGEARFGRLVGNPCIAVADGRASDGTAEVVFGERLNSVSGVAFRAVDTTNYWAARRNGNDVQLLSVTANSGTVQATVAGVGLGTGDTLSVVLAGSAITVLANGVPILTHTSTLHQGGTWHGMYKGGYAADTSFQSARFTT